MNNDISFLCDHSLCIVPGSTDDLAFPSRAILGFSKQIKYLSTGAGLSDRCLRRIEVGDSCEYLNKQQQSQNRRSTALWANFFRQKLPKKTVYKRTEGREKPTPHFHFIAKLYFSCICDSFKILYLSYFCFSM